MKRSCSLFWGIAAALFAVPALSQSLDPNAAPRTVRNAQGELIHYGSSYHSDISLPLAYVAEGAQSLPEEERESWDQHENPENPQPFRPHNSNPDAALQGYVYSRSPDAAMPAPIRNFDGMTGAACGCAPPDTNGEVGKTQYVQMTNSGYQVFDKATGNSVLGPKSTASIWTGFGGVCETAGKGDPIVLYDQLAERWVITQFAGAGVTDECIAVSTSSDATGSYYRYGFHLGSEFYDYPHLGVWPDGYYMSDNVFNAAGTAFLRPQPFAFDRVAMLAGNATASFVTNTSVLTNANAPIQPADLDGTTPPPANGKFVFVEYPHDSKYRVYQMKPDYVTPANTTFALIPNPPSAAAFNDSQCANAPNYGRTCVPTPAGASNFVDTSAGRLMYRLSYRNFGDHESLVGNYTVFANSVSGVRWFELRNITSGTPVVFQESTYQPDTPGWVARRWISRAIWRWPTARPIPPPTRRSAMPVAWSVTLLAFCRRPKRTCSMVRARRLATAADGAITAISRSIRLTIAPSSSPRNTLRAAPIRGRRASAASSFRNAMLRRISPLPRRQRARRFAHRVVPLIR